MYKRRAYLAGGLTLALLWGGGAVGVGAARAQRESPARIAADLRANPLDPAAPHGVRYKRITQLARRVNRLPLERRVDSELVRALEQTFEVMTPGERQVYLRQSTPMLEEALAAFRRLPPEERKALARRALDELGKDLPPFMRDALERQIEQGDVEMVLRQGLAAYVRGDVKGGLDTQALIQAMQRVLQQPEGP